MHLSGYLEMKARQVDEVIPGLIGADLKTLFAGPFLQNFFSYVLVSDEPIEHKDVQNG